MPQNVGYKRKSAIFAAMFSRIRMFLVWLRRIDKCQGFGVQSPSAFRFIRQVVNCHEPYPAYSILEEAQRLNPVARKLGRLFYRLSREVGQATWHISLQTPFLPYYIRCVEHGCDRSDVAPVPTGGPDIRRVLLADGSVESRADAERFMSSAREGDLLVMTGIHDCRANRAEWLRRAADGRCSVGFDLYYCGILFFDKRFKQTYIVNF